MSLARSGLQALKQGADIRKIGFPQETVIHGNILNLSLDADPTGFQNRRRRLKLRLPFIKRQWNTISRTEALKRTSVGVFCLPRC